jgi:predicted 3-demethylubiquinone-9 3-methyltransferase (glyoxalase superfamily)
MEPDHKGTIAYADFILIDTWMAAMDSAREHHFGFNESISFMVNCDSQKELDYYWQQLSAFPSAEQCGWLKDKFGISWQIVPAEMEELMKTSDQERLNRITQSLLKMKKIDIDKLKQAASGNKI